jgi:hypothetical protein
MSCRSPETCTESTASDSRGCSATGRGSSRSGAASGRSRPEFVWKAAVSAGCVALVAIVVRPGSSGRAQPARRPPTGRVLVDLRVSCGTRSRPRTPLLLALAVACRGAVALCFSNRTSVRPSPCLTSRRSTSAAMICMPRPDVASSGAGSSASSNVPRSQTSTRRPRGHGSVANRMQSFGQALPCCTALVTTSVEATIKSHAESLSRPTSAAASRTMERAPWALAGVAGSHLSRFTPHHPIAAVASPRLGCVEAWPTVAGRRLQPRRVATSCPPRNICVSRSYS